MKKSFKITTLFILLICSINVFAQQTVKEKGIELYQKGDFSGVIQILKDGNDPVDLYYLGLAYEKIDETGKAKDSFKKSFAKSYDLFFEKIISLRKNEQSETEENLSDLLQEMLENNQAGYAAAENAYALKSDIFQRNEWRIKAKVLSDSVNLAKKQNAIYASSNKTISGFKIIEKPRANFPKDIHGTPFARLNQSPSKPIIVTIFTVFGADGKIEFLMPVDEIIDAYTVEVLKAAEKIKVKPAMKNNKPVSCYYYVQSSFSFR